jgi:hypothetical protein
MSKELDIDQFAVLQAVADIINAQTSHVRVEVTGHEDGATILATELPDVTMEQWDQALQLGFTAIDTAISVTMIMVRARHHGSTDTELAEKMGVAGDAVMQMLAGIVAAHMRELTPVKLAGVPDTPVQ